MTYNPPGHDVHIMAGILSKLFESRWKAIEKKLLLQTLPAVSKKRKMASPVRETVKPVMTAEERHRLGRQLESLLDELPAQIIDFLKRHSSSGGEVAEEDEIEIDIDVLGDEVLLALQKLMDEYVKGKEAKRSDVEPLGGSGPSNSSLQRGGSQILNEMAVEYVGGNEPPISGTSSDSESSSSEDQSDEAKPMIQEGSSKMPETANAEAQRDEGESMDDLLEGSREYSITGAPEQQKPSSDESDGQPDGNILETPAPSEKQYRAALLKNKFADIILKAREKTLPQTSNKGDPEKLRKEREELELQMKKERARLQALKTRVAKLKQRPLRKMLLSLSVRESSREKQLAKLY